MGLKQTFLVRTAQNLLWVKEPQWLDLEERTRVAVPDMPSATYYHVLGSILSLLVRKMNQAPSVAPDYLTAHSHNTASPAQNLRLEILSLIFRLHVFSQTDYSMSFDINRLQKSKSPPMQLSWVCSYWRQVVLRDPTLWASLSVTSAASHEIFPKAVDLFLEFVFHRSGSTPLKIKVVGRFRSVSQWRLLDRLLSLSDRWSHIVLDIDSSWFFHASRLIRAPPSSLIDNVDGLSRLFEGDRPTATSSDLHQPQEIGARMLFPGLTYFQCESYVDVGDDTQSEFLLYTFSQLETLIASVMRLGPRNLTCHQFSRLTVLQVGHLWLDHATFHTFLASFPMLKSISLFHIGGYSVPRAGDSYTHSHLEKISLHIGTKFSLDAWSGVLLPNARMTKLNCDGVLELSPDVLSRITQSLKLCLFITDLKVVINAHMFVQLIHTLLPALEICPLLHSLTIDIKFSDCVPNPEGSGWLEQLIQAAQRRTRRAGFAELERFQIITKPYPTYSTDATTAGVKMPNESDRRSFMTIRDCLASVGVEGVLIWTGLRYDLPQHLYQTA
ncbi:hypothetical protein D9757_007325 [Collybiopsis confluens]|uniref:F-box domain-containing protein n=1 Tax=Collybiopsis confluens TaxID=2823264 RepID=A0A8H5M6P3_9AGAR|nr:hypothetical protein D9757_007325 [Collybiopsis confluens]